LRINPKATENVLQASLEANATVVLASTSEIYGKNTADALSEDADRIMGSPLVARWSYAAAKGIDECFAHAYHRELGLKVVTARLFNTVGPRQIGTYGMVLPRFVRAALDGRPIEIYGDGCQARCFGWVGDVVSALSKLGENHQAEGRVFNIGSDEEVTINGLAELVRDVVRSNSPVVHRSYKEVYGQEFEDMARRVPDLSRIRDLLGYAPTKTLRQIVETVADHLQTAHASHIPHLQQDQIGAAASAD